MEEVIHDTQNDVMNRCRRRSIDWSRKPSKWLELLWTMSLNHPVLWYDFDFDWHLFCFDFSEKNRIGVVWKFEKKKLFCILIWVYIFFIDKQVQLHDITDKPNGWIQLVKSLIRVVPIEHAMGPSVITLLLDDSPLPTKDSVLEVADMISYSLRRTPRRERNLCVILGCLAEKLAGPSSIAVLSESTLSYLIGNLVRDWLTT